MRKRLALLAVAASLAIVPAAVAQQHGTSEDPAPEPTTETTEPMLEIENARLGTGVEERELVGETSSFGIGEKAWLWLQVVGGPGGPIEVTWHSGQESYTTELDVGASRWRTWAYKTLWRAGEWTVTVSDPKGRELHTQSFVVKEQPAPEEPEASPGS
ncbi:MAG: DUF2914 domain-containing protein [Candidatus Latescibacterota bacterium]|nr:MAG: DUF2914 domain-containing protein [Candidatus Latescibacterota bacterium]